MEEIEPRQRVFKLEKADVLQAIMEFARKGRRGLSEDDVKVELAYSITGQNLTGATVTFNIESDKPAQHPDPTQRG